MKNNCCINCKEEYITEEDGSLTPFSKPVCSNPFCKCHCACVCNICKIPQVLSHCKKCREGYYKYNKFNNGGKKCDLCDYVGEHYCTGRPLLTEEKFKEDFIKNLESYREGLANIIRVSGKEFCLGCGINPIGLDSMILGVKKMASDEIKKKWLSLNLRNDNRENWSKELTNFSLYLQNLL